MSVRVQGRPERRERRARTPDLAPDPLHRLPTVRPLVGASHLLLSHILRGALSISKWIAGHCEDASSQARGIGTTAAA